MDNKKVADLLEQLIHEIKQDGKITLSSADNDKIVFAEGVIKELREEERIKKLVESEQRELDKLAVERLNIEW